MDDPRFAAEPPWILLSVQPPPPGEEILLVEALRRLGARAVEREGERFVALLPPTDDPDDLLRRAEAAIRTGTSLRDPWLAWRPRPFAEWSAEWARALPPRRVGERFVVAPAGSDPPLRPGDLPILLVPGLGFGTAEHPTTRGCLRALEPLVAPGARIADVGAGSGILAIAAARLGAREAVAWEVDPYACAAARANAGANGVADRVLVREVEVRAATLRDAAPFDGVVANLQPEILAPLLPALGGALAPGGWLVVSGVPRPDVAAVRGAAEAAGLGVAEEGVEEGWWTARLAPL